MQELPLPLREWGREFQVAGTLQSIQLSVADLDSTEAFYSGLLDLPVQRALTVPGAPEHLVLDLGKCQMIFVVDSEVAERHPILQARLETFPRGVGMTLHLMVEGIEEIHKAILAEELEVLYPLELKPYGAWELWLFDPDGYLVVLEEPANGRR